MVDGAGPMPPFEPLIALLDQGVVQQVPVPNFLASGTVHVCALVENRVLQINGIGAPDFTLEFNARSQGKQTFESEQGVVWADVRKAKGWLLEIFGKVLKMKFLGNLLMAGFWQF
jgi:hypothetical protein